MWILAVSTHRNPWKSGAIQQVPTPLLLLWTNGNVRFGTTPLMIDKENELRCMRDPPSFSVIGRMLRQIYSGRPAACLPACIDLKLYSRHGRTGASKQAGAV
jgi:hypothetical protein